MRKSFKLILICVAVLLCFGCILCGCSDQKSVNDEANKTEAVTQNAQKGETEEEKSVSDEKSGEKTEQMNDSEVQENEAEKSGEQENVEKTESNYSSLVENAFSGFDGKLSYGVHMYGTGEKKIVGNARMKSASVIKLFIMEYAYNQMCSGEIKSDDIVSGTKLSSLIERMITASDNDATNALINYFGMDKINEYITSNYSETTLQRKMLDYDAAARGEDNYTSVADVMSFLDKLYVNRETYPYNEMIDIMKGQKISTKLRRNMPQGVKMASKTGELSNVENDVGIVFSDKGDYAIVCLTTGGSGEMARNAMAKACRSIYDELQK